MEDPAVDVGTLGFFNNRAVRVSGMKLTPGGELRYELQLLAGQLTSEA